MNRKIIEKGFHTKIITNVNNHYNIGKILYHRKNEVSVFIQVSSFTRKKIYFWRRKHMINDPVPAILEKTRSS